MMIRLVDKTGTFVWTGTAMLPLPSIARRIAGAILALMLSYGPARAQDPSPWGGAERWIGHQAADALTGRGATFFDLPAISAQLPRLLPPARLARFAAYVPSDRVEAVGHFLVARKCKDGDCSAGSITVILDQTSKDMWLVMKESDGMEFSRCWTGTRHYQVLPGALQSAFTTD